MIDTIVLISPYIDKITADKIENQGKITMSIDMKNKEQLYSYTNLELNGSYDYRIRIKLKKDKLISILQYPDKIESKRITKKVNTQPYIEVECSLHKLILGHNCYGGSDDIKLQVEYLIKTINKDLDIKLPQYNEWTIKRIDFAKVYKFNNNQELDKFFKGFSEVYYPRRKVHKYDASGLYFSGSFTTLKLYNKYDEFRKHDYKRLLQSMDINKVNEILNNTKGILRIEIEFKAKKLRHLYNELPTIDQINIKDLENQYYIELDRIFKLGDNNMKTYNKSEEVEKRLKEKYGNASVLLATWYRLSVFGYEKVKSEMTESTFYRHIKMLRDANITWNFTDLKITETNVIEVIFNPKNTELEIKEDLIKNII